MPASRCVRPAILINYDSSRTPTPEDWMEVPDPNYKSPYEKFLEWLQENCACECTGDRGRPSRCVIS